MCRVKVEMLGKKENKERRVRRVLAVLQESPANLANPVHLVQRDLLVHQDRLVSLVVLVCLDLLDLRGHLVLLGLL